MFLSVVGILSALVFLVCDFPYLSDTIKAKIKPQRVTWGVVFLLNVIGLANQYVSGARNSLWLFAAAVIMTGAIFVASLKNGVGGHAKLDIFSLVLALTGVVLWQTFQSPMLSVLANVTVGLVAMVPTYVKARKHPETENGIAYLGGMISCILAAISVGKWELVLLLLPLSAAVSQSYLVYLLYLRKRK